MGFAYTISDNLKGDKMNSIEQMDNQIHGMATEAAGEWVVKQMLNPYASLFVYFKKSRPRHWGALKVAESAPEGYELASDKRISPAFNEAGCHYFIMGFIKTLPIMLV